MPERRDDSTVYLSAIVLYPLGLVSREDRVSHGHDPRGPNHDPPRFPVGSSVSGDSAAPKVHRAEGEDSACGHVAIERAIPGDRAAYDGGGGPLAVVDAPRDRVVEPG